jgi:hypothetical protein
MRMRSGESFIMRNFIVGTVHTHIVRGIKSKRLRCAHHVARVKGRSAFKILTGLTGKRPLRKLRHRWENNIRMDIKERGVNMRNWIDSAQDRDYWSILVNVALNLGFHKPWSNFQRTFLSV